MFSVAPFLLGGGGGFRVKNLVWTRAGGVVDLGIVSPNFLQALDP